MTVKIVLPGSAGTGPTCAHGTRIYTESGHEIKGVRSLQVDFPIDGVVTAKMEVVVHAIDNLEGLAGEVTLIDPRAEDSHDPET